MRERKKEREREKVRRLQREKNLKDKKEIEREAGGGEDRKNIFDSERERKRE